MKLRRIWYEMYPTAPPPVPDEFLVSVVKKGTAIGTIYHIAEVRKVKSERYCRYVLDVLVANDLKPEAMLNDWEVTVLGQPAHCLIWLLRNQKTCMKPLLLVGYSSKEKWTVVNEQGRKLNPPILTDAGLAYFLLNANKENHI